MLSEKRWQIIGMFVAGFCHTADHYSVAFVPLLNAVDFACCVSYFPFFTTLIKLITIWLLICLMPQLRQTRTSNRILNMYREKQ